jgi:hypothetical protein
MPQFDTILVDYVHKRKFPTLGPILTWTLRVTSLAVGVGIYQFNTNDIGAFVVMATTYARPHSKLTGPNTSAGLTELIRRVWTA